MWKSVSVIAAVAAVVFGASASAQSIDHSRRTLAQAKADTATMVDAEVRKVDKDAGKVTLKHQPITNLDMPAMTMVFRVKEPEMLDKLKAGDKVRFAADRVGGQFTVVKIEPMK